MGYLCRSGSRRTAATVGGGAALGVFTTGVGAGGAGTSLLGFLFFRMRQFAEDPLKLRQQLFDMFVFLRVCHRLKNSTTP